MSRMHTVPILITCVADPNPEDPVIDPLVRGTDPDKDPSIIKQK